MRKNRLALLITTMVVASCGSTESMTVQHHLSNCIGVGERLCMLTKAPDEQSWGNFYDGIDGFEYEWGYTYELVVSTSTVLNPPADGSSIDYELVEIVRKDRAPSGTVFDIEVLGEWLTETETGVYRIRDGRIDCATANVCTDIEDAITSKSRLDLRLRHADIAGDPMVIVQIN